MNRFLVNWKPLAVALLPLAAFVAVYSDVFIFRTKILTHDTVNWVAAFGYFLDCLASGSLPLWDPYSFSGAPFFLNHNIIGAFDPTMIAALIHYKWLNGNLIDVYQVNFLMRLAVFYLGARQLFVLLTKSTFSATIGATFALFALGPNSFWQHGSTLIITYVPYAMYSFLRIWEADGSRAARIQSMVWFSYLAGISFNIYLPTYFVVYFTYAFAFLILSRKLRLVEVRGLLNQVGLIPILISVLIFSAMTLPFFAASFELLPKKGEFFSYTRYERDPRGEEIVSETEIDVTKASSVSRSSLHNFMAILLPGPDLRFFVPDRLFTNENFVGPSLLASILVLLFALAGQAPYRGLFLFLIALCAGFQFSEPLYTYFLKYLPLTKTIRQLHNFTAFFILTFGALLAMAVNWLSEANLTRTKKAVLILIGLHLAGIFAYLCYVQRKVFASGVGMDFWAALQQNISKYGWFLFLCYALLWAYLTLADQRWVRAIYGSIISLLLIQLLQFNTALKRYVVQPSFDVHQDELFHYRPFSYTETRVPLAPRHSVLWGFLPSLYRQPTALPTYFYQYMSLSRTTYDFIRLTPVESQIFASGIGGHRYGIFSQFIPAKDSLEALSLINSIEPEELKKAAVVEGLNPEDTKSANLDSAQIRETKRPLTPARTRSLSDFYDKILHVEIPKGSIDQPISISIPHHVRKLPPWDYSHIGFSQIFFGNLSSSYHVPFRYHPGLSVSQLDADHYCYREAADWSVKHVLPGYYPTVYSQPPFRCEIEKTENGFLISPEVTGAFVTDDIGEPYVDKPMKSFDLAFLEREPFSLGGASNIKVLEFGPNHIEFEVTDTSGGLFYYADTFSKYWKAFVDGQKAHIYKSNFAYKGVLLTPGSHTVRFEFFPTVVVLSYIIYALLLLIVPIGQLAFCNRESKS